MASFVPEPPRPCCSPCRSYAAVSPAAADVVVDVHAAEVLEVAVGAALPSGRHDDPCSGRYDVLDNS